MTDNLKLWHSVEKTDPAYTKPFQKGGGFRGTAINAQYLVMRATEAFGPCGEGWWVEVQAEGTMEGAPFVGANGELLGHEKVHWVRIGLTVKGTCAPVIAYGQTTFCGRNKNGFFTDEDAPKKSLTDAVTKALSWLGFGADVHLGRFDDNKCVADRKAEEAKPKTNGAPPCPPTLEKFPANLDRDAPENTRDPFIPDEWDDWFNSKPTADELNHEAAEIAGSKHVNEEEKKSLRKRFLTYAEANGIILDPKTKKFKEVATV